MEEQIKLIIILILSFWTLVKVKNWKTPRKSVETSMEYLEMNDMEIKNEESLHIDVDEIAEIDNKLFPPQPTRRREPREARKYSESRKTMLAESSFDTQSTIIYNNSYFQRSPFGSSANKPIYTNQEYLKEIEHLIVDAPLSPMKVQEDCQPKKTFPPIILTTPKKKSILKQKRFGKRAGKGHPKKVAKKEKSVFDIDQEIKKREEQIKILKRMRQNKLLL